MCVGMWTSCLLFTPGGQLARANPRLGKCGGKGTGGQTAWGRKPTEHRNFLAIGSVRYIRLECWLADGLFCNACSFKWTILPLSNLAIIILAATSFFNFQTLPSTLFRTWVRVCVCGGIWSHWNHIGSCFVLGDECSSFIGENSPRTPTMVTNVALELPHLTWTSSILVEDACSYH